MGGIFGGSKSSSSNQNNGLLTSKLGSVVDFAGQAGNSISNLLNGNSAGFDAYKKGIGADWQTQQGANGIMGSAAARGLLRSGATGKALANYGNQQANQYAGNYFQQLLGLGNMGLQAGQTLAGSGQVSQSKQKNGLGGFLGQMAGGIAASERRVKTDIVKIGEYKAGVNKYRFKYVWDPKTIHVGTMVDEVERVCPEALGPVVDGIQTVNYDKLEVIG